MVETTNATIVTAEVGIEIVILKVEAIGNEVENLRMAEMVRIVVKEINKVDLNNVINTLKVDLKDNITITVKMAEMVEIEINN